MEPESKVGTKIKAYCSACAGDRNCEIRGFYSERGSTADGHIHWTVNWSILTCCGCDHVFAQTASSDSEDYGHYYDDEGNEAIEYYEKIATWPAKSKRDLPEWFSHGSVETDLKNTDALDDSLNELYGALNQDLVVLASIGIRTCFDIAAEILEIDPNNTFRQKLDELVSKAHITEAEREHVETLVDAGSAAAHRGWKPTIQDLETLMSVLENFIYGTMVVPTRRRAQKAALLKVKKKVPQRKSQAEKAAKPT